MNFTYINPNSLKLMKNFTSIVAAGALALSPEARAEEPNQTEFEKKALQTEVVGGQDEVREKVAGAIEEPENYVPTLDEVLVIDLAVAIPEIFGNLSPEEIVDYAQEKIDVLAQAKETMDEKDPRFVKVTQLLAQFEAMQMEATKILTNTLTQFGYTAEQIALLEKEFGTEGLQKAVAHERKDPGLNNWLKMMISKKDNPKFYDVAKTKAEAQLEPEVPMTDEEIAIRNAEAEKINAETAKINAENAQLNTENAQLDAENARLDAENARLDAEIAQIREENEAIANRIVSMFDPSKE